MVHTFQHCHSRSLPNCVFEKQIQTMKITQQKAKLANIDLHMANRLTPTITIRAPQLKEDEFQPISKNKGQ